MFNITVIMIAFIVAFLVGSVLHDLWKHLSNWVEKKNIVMIGSVWDGDKHNPDPRDKTQL